MLSNKLTIKVDGGASISNIFRQFQADILGVPVIALLGESAGEDNGDVYGFSLVYSGNFIAGVEVDKFDSARVFMGINPFDFTWTLRY